jgi:hypothetical protein
MSTLRCGSSKVLIGRRRVRGWVATLDPSRLMQQIRNVLRRRGECAASHLRQLCFLREILSAASRGLLHYWYIYGRQFGFFSHNCPDRLSDKDIRANIRAVAYQRAWSML